MEMVTNPRPGSAAGLAAVSISSSAAGVPPRLPTCSIGVLANKTSFFGSNMALRGDHLVAPGRSISQSNSKGTTVQAGLRSCFAQWSASLFGVKPAPAGIQKTVQYKGKARISKKRAEISNLVQFDVIDGPNAVKDKLAEVMGQKIELQLVSQDVDAETKAPKLSPKSAVEGWVTDTGDVDLVADEDSYSVEFTVPADFGEPGAVIIRNNHPNEFYLQSLAVKAPDGTTIEFPTNAWIYNHAKYPKDRVFFTNKVYLPSTTPPGLKAFRQEELEQYRGPGTGQRQEWDRIYDYDVYNDLGDPDESMSLDRQSLGGNKDFPYPRRIRTGRPMTKADPKSESTVPNLALPYLPSDEVFNRTKNSTFVADFIKATAHKVLPVIENTLSGRDSSFTTLEDVTNLYKSGLPLDMPDYSIDKSTLTQDPDGQHQGSLVYLSTIFSAKGQDTNVLKYAVPQVIQENENGWSKDEEFGRQALAGLHPSVISLVTTYPPTSALDPAEYGLGTALTDQDILPYLEGLRVAEAITAKKLFIIDYHDAFMPFINRVNADTKLGFKCYATRTIFFHSSNGQFKAIAVELSLPPAQKGGASTNRVLTPANATDHLWDLAKIHASAIDSNYHQVLSHFTFCHASMEAIIIASYRQLSQLHPIMTLLKPYFKDTMSINAAARAALINANGVIESNFSMGQYAMQVGSKGYGTFWRFDTQGLPQSLVARGMAEPADESYPGSVKLVFEDYPFAKDGLEMWDAINKWITKYVAIIYKGSDEAIQGDTELQAWWNDIINVGHGDLKDATWWPKLDSAKNLVQIVSTIAWIAGPAHASLNFGQYAYSGFPLNKPSGTRRFVPEKGSADYAELQKNPEKFLLSTITSSQEATEVMTIVEILATHSLDEEYIGTRNSTNWTSDPQVLAAFREFADRVKKIEVSITNRNRDSTLVNRSGPVKVPYTLLFPSSSSGLTGQGVPNSVSI